VDGHAWKRGQFEVLFADQARPRSEHRLADAGGDAANGDENSSDAAKPVTRSPLTAGC
jgi:hypothetical protein